MSGKVVAGVIVGLLVGGVGGFVGGAVVGGKGGVGLVASNWASSEAQRTTETLAVLEQLRARKHDEALEGLETHLSKHVFGLMPSTREGIALDASTVGALEQAARAVKAYRARNPRPEGPSLLEKDVAAFLATVQ